TVTVDQNNFTTLAHFRMHHHKLSNSCKDGKMKTPKSFRYKPFYERFEKPEIKNHSSTRYFKDHLQSHSKETNFTHQYEDYNSTFSSMDTSHDEQWTQHLFDVMAEDEFDYYQNSFYYEERTYDSKGIDSLSEDDYAAFIRKGMYEKQHEQELKDRRKREDEFKQKQKIKQRKLAEMQAEQQRLMRHEQARLQEIRHERRALYLARWKQFDVNGQSSIEFKDIPWPTADIKRLSKVSVEDFLLSGIEDNSEIRSILRQERIRFHPDRWHRWIRRVPTEKQKKKIMETVTEISRTINVLCEEKCP
ncbi:1516_t:CDS:1, partial [Dentiscutata heterogama]